jgi:hypothetical protein
MMSSLPSEQVNQQEELEKCTLEASCATKRAMCRLENLVTVIAVMSSDCETFRCIKNMLSWVKNLFAAVRHSDRSYGYCTASLAAMHEILNILKVIALAFSHVDKYRKVVKMAEKFKEKIDGVVNQHWCSSGVSHFYSKVNRVESAVTAMIIDCIHRLSILPSSHATLPDIFHPNKLNI